MSIVHVPTEVKLMEKKDSFYSELENVLDKIHNTGLLKKEIIFKPTIGYHSQLKKRVTIKLTIVSRYDTINLKNTNKVLGKIRNTKSWFNEKGSRKGSQGIQYSLIIEINICNKGRLQKI
ncbi:craniofacial development protein 2-like [Aphis craccivora]|uniref:Craniofacial development protein 2-like n=1 Tax=Aphis craccivora TaxID=307492 RepID=A0A6G0YJ42_APHCR|nr:craniofacial development protein 2-like [Aphis craccivora]